jgi:SAM-dependent methyltransferase
MPWNDSAMSYDPFAAVYATWSAGMTDDIPFYVELARGADGPIVELAVGTGRVAAAIARETGKRVVGIDSSAAMLEQARATGADLDLRLGDMRELELDEPAALVICPFRSLLHLPGWHAKREVFEHVHSLLRPGGRFAWNAFVFDHVTAVAAAGEHELPVPHRNDYFPHDSRVDITLLENGARISLWWCTRAEWEGLLDVSGLETEALYGSFDRRPFAKDAREFVWVARRPT